MAESSPTTAALVDAAVQRLLSLPSAQVFRVAHEKGVPFYRKDAPRDPVPVRDQFGDDAGLRRALEGGDQVARRSALMLLAAVDPVGAWPWVRPFLHRPPPAQSPGLKVAAGTAPSLVVTIPCVPDEELIDLLDGRVVSAPALVGAALHHRKKLDERLRLLERTLERKMDDGTWRLAETLCQEISERSGKRVSPLLRRAAAADLGWKAWAHERLAALGDASALADDVAGLDAAQPQRAINAAIALGPARWPDLQARFFTEAALASRAGRARAASILHSILTAVMIERAAAWKKAKPLLALVDRLANPRGDTLAFGAASLAAVLRGKKPLSRE